MSTRAILVVVDATISHPEDFRTAAHRHADWVADYFERTRSLPVLAQVKPGEIAAVLSTEAPEHGESLENILADFDATLLKGMTLWNHPRFFAYFPNSSSPPSVLADFLSSALNANVMLWRTSPTGTELEQVTLGWLRQWLALPETFFGIIYDTASISVLHALAAAREAIAPDVRTRGMHAGLTVYISEQTHSSSEKAAILLGFGQENVRKIAVDAAFRMRADLLQAAIDEDLSAGKRPCCIVASVGSTSTTAVDPVAAIADIAELHGIWLHVDAAYAGSAAILPEFRWLLDGVDRADSVVLNPHKWLYVSVDCSIFYTRRPEILRRAFSLTAEYLKTAEDSSAVNFMDYGIQLGRRFRALKLWYVFRHYGRDGITALLRESIRLTGVLVSLIEADEDFELSAPVPLALVCFRHRSGDEVNRRLLEEINRSGFAFLSHTVLCGQYVLRFGIGNFQTAEQDVRDTWSLLQATSRKLAVAVAAETPA